jgi:hypothetical protein
MPLPSTLQKQQTLKKNIYHFISTGYISNKSHHENSKVKFPKNNKHKKSIRPWHKNQQAANETFSRYPPAAANRIKSCQ